MSSSRGRGTPKQTQPPDAWPWLTHIARANFSSPGLALPQAVGTSCLFLVTLWHVHTGFLLERAGLLWLVPCASVGCIRVPLSLLWPRGADSCSGAGVLGKASVFCHPSYGPDHAWGSKMSSDISG